MIRRSLSSLTKAFPCGVMIIESSKDKEEALEKIKNLSILKEKN